jgi:hypothetical protein
MISLTVSIRNQASRFRRWLNKASQSQDAVILQLYLSSLLGITGRIVYDTYVPNQHIYISATRILVSAILITAVFTWIYSRFKAVASKMPFVMRFFVGFQLGFVADSVVGTLLLRRAHVPLL